MTTLLVVHHSPSGSMRSLTASLLEGARDDALEGLEVRERPALEASAEDVLACAGIVLATPANFGYMSGALKHFFDTTFLDIGGSLSDDGSAAGSTGGKLPYGLVVHGRYDVTGAVRAVQSITGALPWRQSADVVEVLGEVDDDARRAAYELGATIGALALD